jgi:serine/threonine-protein kinase
VWALGVTLYELLAGRSPFHADKLEVVCALVTMQPPPPLSPLRPDLPAGLEAVIMACLEKEPDRRMPSVAALAAALAPFGPERAKRHAEQAAAVLGEQAALSRPTVELPPSASAPAETAPLPAVALTGTTGGGSALAQATLPVAPPKRRRGLTAAALAALAAGGALAALVLGTRGPSPHPDAGPSSAQPGPAASSAMLPIEAPRVEITDAGTADDAGASAPTATATATQATTAAPAPKSKPPIHKPEPAAEPPKPPPVKAPGTTYNL